MRVAGNGGWVPLRMRCASVVLAASVGTGLAAGTMTAAPALAAARQTPSAPPPLSADPTTPSIASAYGSGSFGHWLVDPYGLPAYDYSVNEAIDPNAKQPELAGATGAQHQLGND